MLILQVGDLVCLTGDYPTLAMGTGIVVDTHRSPRAMHAQGVVDVLWSNGEFYQGVAMTSLIVVDPRKKWASRS